MRWTIVLAALLTLAIRGAEPARADFITNGSFETGNFSGWTAVDLANPFFPLSVQTLGSANTFGWPWSSTPTNGSFTAFSGFDGAGPGHITLSQNVVIPAGLSSTISFDYRAAWDLLTFGATLNRTFDVELLNPITSTVLLDVNILTARAGTSVSDTGPLTGTVNVSAFAGQTVTLRFDLFIPEVFSGPAQFQLDNVRSTSSVVPEPASAIMLGVGLVGVLGLAGYRRAPRSMAPPGSILPDRTC